MGDYPIHYIVTNNTGQSRKLAVAIITEERDEGLCIVTFDDDTRYIPKYYVAFERKSVVALRVKRKDFAVARRGHAVLRQ